MSFGHALKMWIFYLLDKIWLVSTLLQRFPPERPAVTQVLQLSWGAAWWNPAQWLTLRPVDLVNKYPEKKSVFRRSYNTGKHRQQAQSVFWSLYIQFWKMPFISHFTVISFECKIESKGFRFGFTAGDTDLNQCYFCPQIASHMTILTMEEKVTLKLLTPNWTTGWICIT